MSKRIVSLILIIALIFSVSASASPKHKNETAVTVFPATETTINGIPESQLITPKVVFPWIFSHYDPDHHSTNHEFKEIVQFDLNNTNNTSIAPMLVTVTSSSSQGSEWSGSVDFTASVKTGVFGGLEAQTGIEYKEYRSTNEAVGLEAGMNVDPGKYGHIKFWYKGETTDGDLVYYRYNDYTGEKEYKYEPIDATFYISDSLKYTAETWQDYSPE